MISNQTKMKHIEINEAHSNAMPEICGRLDAHRKTKSVFVPLKPDKEAVKSVTNLCEGV